MMSKLLSWKAVLFGVIAVWSLVTLGATAGLYKLWWDRERNDYLGKSVSEQRQKIWQIAGLSTDLLGRAEEVDRIWPFNARYSAKGDANQLSYAKYILLPRIPDGSSNYTFSDSGQFAPAETSDGPVERPKSSGWGFAFSIVLLGAIGKAIQRILVKSEITLPESVGLALLLNMLCVTLPRLIVGSAVPGFYSMTVLGLVAFVFVAVRWQKRGRHDTRSSSKDFSFRDWNSLLILLIVLLVTWSFLMSVVVVIDDWDAWAIWGAKAKVLALGHGSLADVTYFGHPDYPLLWPALWAFTGWLSGGWEDMWSRGWGAFFLALCVWEIVIVVRRATGNLRTGLLAGACFASMPMVPLIASWSYAEAPFWLLTVACLGCLLNNAEEGRTTRIVCAAILATAAAYTKNEGAMFAVIMMGWMIVALKNCNSFRIALFLAVFVLCYFPWYYWIHSVLQVKTQALTGLGLNVATLQYAMSRVSPALEAIANMWLDVKQWNIVLWCALAFILPGCLLSRDGWKWFVVPVGMFCGYFLIVLIQHDEIYWQIGTAWNRLTLHVMPLLIVGEAIVIGSWLGACRGKSVITEYGKGQ